MAHKCRGLLMIWSDPDTIRAAKPTGRLGQQPHHSDTAIQSRLTMKVLSGMGLRRNARRRRELALPDRPGDRVAFDFGTFRRRQKSLAVNIPQRGYRVRCNG